MTIIGLSMLLALALAWVGRLGFLLAGMRKHLAAREARDRDAARAIELASLQRAELFRIDAFDSAFAAVTYPAREAGGDMYSIFSLGDGRIAFGVGDVSGRGVLTAVFMHVARNAIEWRMRAHAQLEEAFTRANAHLCGNNPNGLSVTAWFGVFDPATGIVEYVNAGHDAPYVLRASGRLERIESAGDRMLGVFPEETYASQRLRLGRGDRLFAYTNGVIAAQNAHKQEYGDGKLAAVLRKCPADLCAAVKADVDAFVGRVEPDDDRTMLVLSFFGRPEEIEQSFVTSPDELAGMVEFVRGVVRFRYPEQEDRLLRATDMELQDVIRNAGSPTVILRVRNVPGRCSVSIVGAGGATHNPLNRPAVKRLVSAITHGRQDGKNILTLVQLDFDGHYRQVT